MKNTNETKMGAYGRELEGALARWEGDPRSAIGANAIGRATSSNEGAWVPPRDVNFAHLGNSVLQEKSHSPDQSTTKIEPERMRSMEEQSTSKKAIKPVKSVKISSACLDNPLIHIAQLRKENPERLVEINLEQPHALPARESGKWIRIGNMQYIIAPEETKVNNPTEITVYKAPVDTQ